MGEKAVLLALPSFLYAPWFFSSFFTKIQGPSSRSVTVEVYNRLEKIDFVDFVRGGK